MPGRSAARHVNRAESPARLAKSTRKRPKTAQKRPETHSPAAIPRPARPSRPSPPLAGPGTCAQRRRRLAPFHSATGATRCGHRASGLSNLGFRPIRSESGQLFRPRARSRRPFLGANLKRLENGPEKQAAGLRVELQGPTGHLGTLPQLADSKRRCERLLSHALKML